MYHPTLLQAVITLTLLGATLASTVRAEEERHDTTPIHEEVAGTATVDSLPINRIDRIDVVDRQTLLFYLNNSEVYLNRLPRPCIGLNKHSAVLYKTSQPRLSALDIITVLRSGGSDMERGASCGLGKFEMISAEDAKALKKSTS
ncbi:DUF6491 family protein [Pseudomaricurvus sp. HS19]|uniref:DUF6491 family protein n=1 Tax=Pseudomaricurvus sp. HS19 TaxID=2692626 RepID=UPI001371F929|nr:DUF6491 family protein [Pseudomaricurvus sp. HS19]MYM64401.1 hypothetical protein [Pseudomaricurvus sp. HS19]